MTPEEALKILDETVIGNLELKIVLSKALEKQIAKKPKTFTLPYSNKIIANYCPVCDNDEIDHEYKKTHCDNCGQKIDWSEEE